MLTINLSINCSYDYLKRRGKAQNYRKSKHTTPFKLIRIFNCLYFAGYVHMHCLKKRSFPHLSEHQTSFQAVCRYNNDRPPHYPPHYNPCRLIPRGHSHMTWIRPPPSCSRIPARTCHTSGRRRSADMGTGPSRDHMGLPCGWCR